jgi:hypothetical protein
MLRVLNQTVERVEIYRMLRETGPDKRGDGVLLSRVDDVLHRFGVASERTLLTPAELRFQALPSILVVDSQAFHHSQLRPDLQASHAGLHFVLCLGVDSDDRFVLFDIPEGERLMTADELQGCWSGACIVTPKREATRTLGMDTALPLGVITGIITLAITRRLKAVSK